MRDVVAHSRETQRRIDREREAVVQPPPVSNATPGGGGVKAFPAVIVSCNKTTGRGTVKRTATCGSTTPISGTPTLQAWLGVEPFDQAGAAVMVTPIEGDSGGAEVMVHQYIRAAGLWAEPTAGQLATNQDNPSQRTYCTG